MARRTSKKSKASKRKKISSSKQTSKPILAGIPPQRRIDIFGILLLVIGLLTLLSLFTQTTGSITGWWVRSLSIAFGWDVYLLPIALIGLGAWMLLRNMEKLPKLSAERLVGILLFFFNLTAWFHLFIDGGYQEAQLGVGGGYLGAFFKISLVGMLGKPGAVIALIAWLLISLILTLDLAMANILKSLGDLIEKLYNLIANAIKERQAKKRPTPAVAPVDRDQASAPGKTTRCTTSIPANTIRHTVG